MDQCKEWMEDATAKCLYWGLILVLLIMVWWHVSSAASGAEHMGEWSSALINASNHKRMAVGLDTIDNGGQEWGDALSNESQHLQGAMSDLKENFRRSQRNVDTREDELMGRLRGGDPW
jgi:hypothetical protein